MMTSAVMSSQSAVEKKHKSWISDDDVSSDFITISSELQYNQSMKIFQTGIICVQRIEFEQRLFKGEDLKEEDDD
ncbi:hypothetical protein F511_27961 [Dorcoceras hygrometricum]|uniref:Uncharacterized protein n=1 Tax=Dorcoceras hygrometricum TaxID=472368 RepID=A0A2Z7B0J9_9LAMI|nr:hypothetical protein F511_27961 [Dorcoceras hygrometricum]